MNYGISPDNKLLNSFMNTDLRNQKNNIRTNIIDTLYLISSKEKQLGYQEKVPIACISAELFYQWDDHFVSEKNDDLFRETFNEHEQIILCEFNEVFEHVAEVTPDVLPDIHDFIKTHEWSRLSKAACTALEKLSNAKIYTNNNVSQTMNNLSAQDLLGHTTLIGITYLNKDGEIESRKQLHGKITAITHENIEISLSGVNSGKIWSLPPDFSNFSRATPGIYNLRYTGESVENPDYLCTWVVHLNSKEI